MLRLRDDLKVNAWGSSIILPKGTLVKKVEGRGGGLVIYDKKLLMDLIGNTHDPEYRYLWVNAEDVENVAE